MAGDAQFSGSPLNRKDLEFTPRTLHRSATGSRPVLLLREINLCGVTPVTGLPAGRVLRQKRFLFLGFRG